MRPSLELKTIVSFAVGVVAIAVIAVAFLGTYGIPVTMTVALIGLPLFHALVPQPLLRRQD